MRALEFDRVSCRYPEDDFDIIDDLSFSVEAGSFHCIVGASGCGKSTILRLTCGLLRPKAGTIRVNGRPIAEQSHCCGYMPQRDLLFPWRTVGENLALPLEIRGGYTRAERRELAEEALADVGLAGCRDKMPSELSGGMRQRAAFARTMLAGSCRDKMPSELSGGMRQRAAFARTMLAGSDLLLLDEPFSALDFLTRVSMQEWLLEQWEKHRMTILFITHDVEEAVFLSGSVLAVDQTPIRRLSEIPVPAPDPRTRACLARPEMAELREELIEMLRRQVEV